MSFKIIKTSKTMKKIIYPILFSFLFLFSLNQTKSQCLLAKAYPYTNFWDSCSNNKGSLNAYVAFKAKSSCFKYEWTVNGNLVDSSYLLHYTITQNGTYDVCVKVKDTCNNCDTSICSKRTITCFSSTCNWANRYGKVNNFDSCSNNAASMNAYIYFNYGSASCFKYEWTVNGSKVSSGTNYPYYIKYQITQNGTYNLCVKVTDTCNNCDTTFCSKRTFTCFNSSGCNWKARYTNTYFWDSCNSTTQSLNAYVSFQNYSTRCFKYQWTVNGTVVDTTHNILNYKISKNGTYDVCIKVIDTCNNCDTTICSKRAIACFSSGSTCNWSARPYNYYVGDSCYKSTSSNISAYIAFKTKGCYTYQWTVGGNNAGTGLSMQYSVSKNATYSICVKVTDTCNNCDTTICWSKTVTCIAGNCNWASRYPNSIFRDSCKNTSVSLFGYISFNSNLYKCFKYQWTVNGNAVGSGQYISYTVTQNGTYNVCVKVTDTCNNCDTTICSTRTITCLGGCNWASKTPYTYLWDSCKSNLSFVNAYISFKTKGCYKYQWTVNGNNAGNGYVMKYAIFNAGTYDICVKVTDTCNNCDTTICVKYKTKCYNGIDNIELNEGINIYPNPTQGVIKLDWNKGNSSYVIYNISSQSIATGYLTNGAQTLDLSTYPTGLYILQIKAADANITKKIFLQKE